MIQFLLTRWFKYWLSISSSSVPAQAEDSCPCKCPPCGLLATVGHCLQQVALLLLLVYCINLCGVVQVLVWVPFRTISTIYRAPTVRHALRKNTKYLRNVLVSSFISYFTFAVLQYVFGLVLFDELEVYIIGCLPHCVMDTYQCLIATEDQIYFK